MGGGGVMVWGAFSSAGVGELIRCDKSVNAAEYLKILRKGLIPSIKKLFPGENVEDVVFQHDNAPAHTAKVTKQYLERNSIKTMFWPGQSPDLNPIENLWAYIEGKLAGQRFSNVDDLWKAVKLEWENIDISRCSRLSRSVVKRLVLLKKAKGKAIAY
jgi:transposase